MYLKSIEVHGFKSFANKINFQFHNGITAIVGPNGSGKSNVADAVRWVLGEQRIKQLRGASMQDVIFSGTETRKPLGYAYVAITLDNSDRQLAIDYEEVTVARRIYRSGESEYLINGTSCRLKDVSELFYDTGIGKEGYSIIGQGQIDKILNGKPEERRELFDEAAGIVKFKRRKATAQKKLEDEKLNLVRVKDILSELEKQIGPLEKQSETAKTYLKKKEELKILDVNVFLSENRHAKEQLMVLEKNCSIAAADLEETTKQFEAVREEYEQIQNKIENLDTIIEEARTKLTDASVLRGKLEGEINVLKEQIHSADSNKENFSLRLEAVQKELTEKQTAKKAVCLDKARIDEELKELSQARDVEKSKLLEIQAEVERYSSDIEAGKSTIITALNERATIKSKMGRYDTMTEQVNIRRAELNSRLLRVKSDEVQQDELIRELEEEFHKVTDEIEHLNDDQQKIEEDLLHLRDGLAAKDQLLRDEQVVYHQDKSKLDALSNLTERYEGYGSSVRRVMELKDEETGIIGVVADIIKVEKKYETAIETALGGNIQNIVTDTEETAKKMISFLKKTKGGRATFLPLTSMKNPVSFKNQDALKEKGVIGTADSLIQISDSYKDVAKSLLGRVLVVDHIDHAVIIARKYHYTIRMVTIDGEQLVPGGAISGGAYKNSSNLLGRRREMDDLESRIKDDLKRMDVLLEEIEKIKSERNTCRIRLEEVKALIQKKFIEQNTARLGVIKAKERRNETESGFDELVLEQDSIEKQLLEIKENKEATLDELKESIALEQKMEQQVKEQQEEWERLRLLEAETSQKMTQSELVVQKVLQQQEFMNQNLERMEGECSRFLQELSEIQDSILQTVQEKDLKRESLDKLLTTVEASHFTQSDAEKQLKEHVMKKDELSSKQKDFFRKREELAERMTSLDKEVFRLNSQKDKLEESMESYINYMWNEYEITYSDAVAMKKEEWSDLSGMKQNIASIKDEIRKLGDVNVNAIEDFKNLFERYEFLKAQHEDLVTAEQTLIKIIEELDDAMRRQFEQKFKEICQEFDKVFKELFGGGKGTLELMEDEDILEAGIRIIAQPPGKKLQNMMQLSGGEKALAAIALLFAIQNLKPSPFCLLDEIEAALDESNVGRFSKYLHKLTKNTQFIVITHRRGTMERADRLYGITMQEKGVSALVSVNLIDNDLN